MNEFMPDGYRSLFELGLFNEDPAVKVLDVFEICPTSLAALVTALFETVMKTVPDKKQIQFEKHFNDALQILMQERFEYDVTVKYFDEDV